MAGKHLHVVRDAGCLDAAEEGRQQPFEWPAVAQHGRLLARGRHQPVHRRVDGQVRAHDGGFLAEHGCVQPEPPLPVQLGALLVDRAREEHQPQRLAHHVIGGTGQVRTNQVSLRGEDLEGVGAAGVRPVHRPVVGHGLATTFNATSTIFSDDGMKASSRRPGG